MSYIENRRSIEDYLDSIRDRSKNNYIGSILNQFNLFCKRSFNKSHQQVIDDIKEQISKTNSNDKIYVLFNKYRDGHIKKNLIENKKSKIYDKTITRIN